MSRTASPLRRRRRTPISATVIVLASAVCSAPVARGQSSGLTAAIHSDQWVPPGTAWKFFRGTAEPSGGTLAWTARDFNDAGWETGPAGFGFGDADDATPLNDMPGRYSTVYLRRLFEVPSLDDAGDLELSVDYDDGFVAFLNGREIARANAGSLNFRSFSTDSHEAGTAETFPVAASLLTAGVNVLAIVGFNSSLTSGDFSLHPALGSRGVAAEGCPGDYYVASAGVRLAGKAPLPATTEVRVNGELAVFEAATGDWRFTATLTGPSREFQVEARDQNGAPLASRTLRAIRASVLDGTLETDTVLKSAGSPYVVVRDVVVPAGRRLSIEAGCEFLIAPDAGFEIGGEIQAHGTLAAPIRFTRVPCGENWENFRFEEARGQNSFRFCEWSFGSGSSGAAGVLTLDDSNLELESCVIRDIDGEGVHSVDGTVRIRNCLTERTREALSLDSGDTVVEYCTIRDAVGKSDLIDCNRSSVETPARIAFNHIYNTTDDGIDADDGAVFAEGNIIHDCGDQALSLVGDGRSTVLRNLCYRNGNGLSVKDRHEVLAEFNTFTLNTVTGVRAIEKTRGELGGIITLRNSIVWGNEVQLLVESEGEIRTEYCDVQGTLPPGPGNLNLDPRFFDPEALEFHLRDGSPCIGAADDGGDLGAFRFERRPNAPTNLLAAAPASDRVLLTWRDNSFAEDGVEVERAAGAGAYQLRATLAAGTVSYEEEGLAAGTTYQYRVRAFNALGNSEYSNVADFTAEISVPRPEILSVEPAEGPAEGGTAVVIRGRNFGDDATARLDGAFLQSLEVLSDGEIQAVTPAGVPGPADLRVTSGGAEAVLAGGFRYYQAHLRGDANGDGTRNVSDVLAILVYLFQEGPPPPCEEVADVQQSGEVDLGDALALLFYLFGAGAAPAPDEARCF